MGKYYLAVDIGASSGRHILAELRDGQMILQEVHRFQNGMEEKNGALCWYIEHLFSEIKAGMKKCGEIGKIPVSVSVDTWGVDFVLLDEKDQVIGDTVGYRDRRTEGMDHKVEAVIPQNYIVVQESRNSPIIQSTSCRRSKKSIRNSWKKQKTCLCCRITSTFY